MERHHDRNPACSIRFYQQGGWHHFPHHRIQRKRREYKLDGDERIRLVPVKFVVERTGPVTSEDLAKMMATNPVVVRRIMAGLRQQGYVRSEKGHGGGWTLACDLSKVTLRDIYVAIGSPSLLAIGHRTEAPGCLVEQAVNASLHQAFHDAEELLLTSFGEVTLADISVSQSSG